jgi:beta-1,4-mannosyltransferase
MIIKIHPFPAPGNNNMFLQLFYKEENFVAEGCDFKIEPLTLRRLLKEDKRKMDANHIIHIHWASILYGSRFIIKSLYLMLVNFITLFLLKKVYGMKICWTMHNYKAHDYPHPLIDKIGRKILFFIADGIIIQQEQVFNVWHKKYPDRKIKYNPLGNYISAYGPAIFDRNIMRKDKGFSANDIIILSLGVIKPYKKIEHIIEAFHATVQDNNNLRLVIVGKADKKYLDYLQSLTGGSRRIFFENIRIPDRDMPKYFSFADYSVFWYDDSVLTSGGIPLSLSYGAPVISRNIPAAEGVKDGINGYLFNNINELSDIFKNLSISSQFDRYKIIQSIKSFDWANIAKETALFYTTL